MRRDALAAATMAIGAAVIGFASTVFVHEWAHLAVEYVLTGGVTRCANGTPFSRGLDVVEVCLSADHGALILAGITANGAIGIGLLWLTSLRELPSVFAVGLFQWVMASLYGLGAFSNPVDLEMAVEAVGPFAYLPGIAFLVAGLVLLERIRRSGEPNRSGTGVRSGA